MGAANVKAVFAQWRHLPDRAHRALTWMAHRSYDKAMDGKRARVYSTVLGNLQALCAPCNGAKGDLMPDEWDALCHTRNLVGAIQHVGSAGEPEQ